MSWLLMLACAPWIGCGGPNEAEPTQPISDAPEVADPDTNDPDTNDPEAASMPVLSPGPFAAFAVYNSYRTTLVPVDGRAPIEADGLWVPRLTDPRTIARYLTAEASDAGLPTCACASQEGACSAPLSGTVHVAEEITQEWEHDCTCLITEDTAHAEPLEYATRPNGFSLGPCTDTLPPPEPLSLVGGTFYGTDWGSPLNEPCNDGSEAPNLYDLWGYEVPLAGPVPTITVRGELRCSRNETYLDPLTQRYPSCAGELDEEDRWDDPCDERQIDFAYPVLGRGRLCRAGAGVSGDGRAWYCARCAPLTPDICPSELDPCGSRAPFGDLVPEDQLYWVATDGSFALTRTAVVARDGTQHPFSLPDHVIGVLFVADGSPLAAAMAYTPTVVARGDEPWDRSCTDHNDCDVHGECGARCEHGSCGEPPDGTCDETFPCEASFRCDDGVCVECSLDTDCRSRGVSEYICVEGACIRGECEDDRDCDDGDACRAGRCVAAQPCDRSLDASAHGNRCATEMRAERWSQAQHACRCALDADPSPPVRGAIEYNLGRIAEGQNDRRLARTHYQRSLASRPNNEAVRARLDALSSR